MQTDIQITSSDIRTVNTYIVYDVINLPDRNVELMYHLI
jgi:hypothetical protein